VCLSRNQNTSEWIGKIIPETGTVCTEEMAQHVQVYVDFVRNLGGEQEYEQTVSYHEWIPEGFGTFDASAITPDTLHIIDFKYGKGVPVSAEDNPQGKLYLLAVLLEREAFQEFSTVKFSIVQPRLDSISTWESTPKEIYTWGRKAAEAAKLAMEDHAPRVPGDKQCRFCAAKPVCPALMKFTEDTMMKQFENLDALPEQLTFAQLSQVLKGKTLIEKWLKSVEEYIKSRIEGGETVPGWKLVSGRSVRKWADESVAEKILAQVLGEDAYTKKLLTAPQAEKKLPKDQKGILDTLIVKPPGLPTLAPEDDPRESIIINADSFD